MASPLQELRRARGEFGAGTTANGTGGVDSSELLATPSPPRRLVRHSASASQPSSLAPFAASLDLPRKSSLQPESAYPMLASRTDVMPSQTSTLMLGGTPSPPPSLPKKNTLKAKPPPIKVPAASSGGGTFLTPLIKFVKDKGEKGEEGDKSREKAMRVNGKKGTEEHIHIRLGESRPSMSEDEPISITLANRRGSDIPLERRTRSESAGSVLPPRVVGRKPVPTIPLMDQDHFDAIINSDAPTRKLVLPPPSALSTRITPHRRASSYDDSESPKLLSSATFGVSSRERPATSYEPPDVRSDSSLMDSQRSSKWSPDNFPEPHLQPRTRSRSRSRPHLHPTSHSPPPGPTNRSASSPAIIAPHLHFEYPKPKSPPALRSSFRHSRSASAQSLTFNNHTDAFLEPTTPTAATHKKAKQPSLGSSTSSPQSASMVGISLRDGSGARRELAKARIGDGGVAVTLSSTHRPEDLEVGWTVVPGVDEEGRPITQWEIKLRPRVSTFSGYHLGSIPNPPLPATFSSPTSPRTNSRQQDHSREEYLDEPFAPHARKASGASEKFSGGSSFSSESSGPLTPRRPKIGVYEAELDAVTIAFPVSPNRRIGRAASYASVAEQYRQRQSSIEGDGSRNSSLNGAEDKRSPRNHRFGVFIAPVGDLEALKLADGGTETLLDDVGLSSPSGSSDHHFHAPPTLRSSHGRQRTKSDQALEALSSADLASNADQDSEGEDDQFGPSKSDIEKANARGMARAISRWSDTDGEAEEDGPQTSWSDVPDGEE